jgi:hypothetical protein
LKRKKQKEKRIKVEHKEDHIDKKGQAAFLFFFQKQPVFFCYAKMIKATTGITKIIELATHHIAHRSPRILPLAPVMAAPNAARPLIKAISSAINPRVRPPTPAPKFLSLRKAAGGGPLARCHSRSPEGGPLVTI